MLIKNQFDVAEPVDKVWEFFGNVPQVAACLPGAELTEDLGDETYGGTVGIRMGPVNERKHAWARSFAPNSPAYCWHCVVG